MLASSARHTGITLLADVSVNQSIRNTLNRCFPFFFLLGKLYSFFLLYHLGAFYFCVICHMSGPFAMVLRHDVYGARITLMRRQRLWYIWVGPQDSTLVIYSTFLWSCVHTCNCDLGLFPPMDALGGLKIQFSKS